MHVWFQEAIAGFQDHPGILNGLMISWLVSGHFYE